MFQGRVYTFKYPINPGAFFLPKRLSLAGLADLARRKAGSFVTDYSAHTSKETREYLTTMAGLFEFVFTPEHGSWLNLFEGFFSKLTLQMLREIRVAD